MHIDLTDKVALVTGSARRVGKAIALELAQQGVHVLVHYGGTAEDVVRETMQDVKSLGVEALAFQADLSQPEEIEALFAAAREHFGRLDILINSASIFQKRQLLDVTFDDWEKTMAINLRAPFLCTQKAAQMMAENDPPGGAIVNICDKGALEPWPEYAHHGVSKAGLLALTQVSAVSLGPHIRVNAVIPGPVMKPAGTGMTDGAWEQLGETTALQKTGEAGDVGRAVAYLVAEDFLSGTTLHVNGGEHLVR